MVSVEGQATVKTGQWISRQNGLSAVSPGAQFFCPVVSRLCLVVFRQGTRVTRGIDVSLGTSRPSLRGFPVATLADPRLVYRELDGVRVS